MSGPSPKGGKSCWTKLKRMFGTGSRGRTADSTGGASSEARPRDRKPRPAARVLEVSVEPWTDAAAEDDRLFAQLAADVRSLSATFAALMNSHRDDVQKGRLTRLKERRLVKSLGESEAANGRLVAELCEAKSENRKLSARLCDAKSENGRLTARETEYLAEIAEYRSRLERLETTFFQMNTVLSSTAVDPRRPKRAVALGGGEKPADGPDAGGKSPADRPDGGVETPADGPDGGDADDGVARSPPTAAAAAS